MTPDIRKQMWMGDHSHSWLLLSEMIEFSKTVLSSHMYQRSGIVSIEGFRALKPGEGPESWCSSIGGPGIEVITAAEALEGKKGSHVRMEWKMPALDCLYTFNKYIEELKELAETEKVDHDQVRLVFGFDS